MMHYKEDINLLPPSVQKFRWSRLYFDRLGQMLRVLLFSLLIAVAVVGGMWAVYFTSTRSSLAPDGGEEPGDIVSRVQSVNGFVSTFDEKTQQQVIMAPRIAALLQSLPTGVRISEVVLDETDQVVVIRGIVVSSQVLATLQQSLEALPWVADVQAPLQNFATESRGEFSFTLGLDHETVTD